MSKEIELLQEAIEWMHELRYVWSNSRDSGDYDLLDLLSNINKVEKLLSQPEQEPFAWCIESKNSADWCFAADKIGVIENSKFLDENCKRSDPFPLYTSPPKREPLSDEHLISAAPQLLEVLENWINALDDPSEWMKCRDDAKKAIEKAHGIGVDDE